MKSTSSNPTIITDTANQSASIKPKHQRQITQLDISADEAAVKVDPAKGDIP
jgi:hypothetical protein